MGQGLDLLGRVRLVTSNEAICLIPDSTQLAIALLSHSIFEVSACSLEVGGPALLGPGHPVSSLRDQVAGFGAGRMKQLIQPGLGLDQALEILERGMILGELSRFVHVNLVSHCSL